MLDFSHLQAYMRAQLLSKTAPLGGVELGVRKHKHETGLQVLFSEIVHFEDCRVKNCKPLTVQIHGMAGKFRRACTHVKLAGVSIREARLQQSRSDHQSLGCIWAAEHNILWPVLPSLSTHLSLSSSSHGSGATSAKGVFSRFCKTSRYTV